MAQSTYAQAVEEACARLRAASIADDRLEAQLLLAHVLRRDREHLIAASREALGADEQARFDALLARRLRHEPLAYITGHREFYGLDILCSPAALIPRPESELLVDLALDRVRARRAPTAVTDVGTGTGAIACAIAANAADAQVTAIDRSPDALELAGRNVDRLGLAGRVTLRASDLLEDAGTSDVIVANLPYIAEAMWATLEREVRDFEPREALVACS